MNDIRAMINDARAEVEAFEVDAIEMIEALLPTSGNVWKGNHHPTGPGIYAIWEPGEIRPVWVGHTKQLQNRMRAHVGQKRYDRTKHILTIFKVPSIKKTLRDFESVALWAFDPKQATVQRPYRRGISPAFRDRVTEIIEKHRNTK